MRILFFDTENPNHLKILAVMIAFSLIGFFLGTSYGSYVTIKAIASITEGFVDEGLIREAIYMYQNNIRNCFPSNWSV